MKKIIVTGGAGFVGSNLCRELSKDADNEVFSIDNYFTGSKENHHPGVNYIEGDAKDISKLVDFSPDIIFHLGEYSRVEQSFEDVELVWSYNRDGIISILEFCRKHNSKLVYAGSSTKFGDDGAGKDSSPYAWSKASNTELVINYSKWFDLKYAITYFYNVYGDNEISRGKYATLIGIYSKKISKNEPLTVVLPGTQLRNFTHVKDIVSGLMLVAQKGDGDGYGIGHDHSYSVLDVAEMFGGPIEYLPERKGNRMSAEVLNHQVKELGWSAKYNLPTFIDNLKACMKVI